MTNEDWEIPKNLQPDPGDYSFDLDRALRAVVGIKSYVPGDAFTANTLGTERAGSGVVIRDSGLVATIGYLVTEADAIWITCGDGRAVPGHALAYDQESGFGLVQTLGKLALPALEIGDTDRLRVGDPVVFAASGGRKHAIETKLVGRQEFAGYWEYALDEAIFTYPSHPNWGGTGLISASGELLGIGSLQIERANEGKNEHLNMIVPIDLLKPILNDLRKFGRVNKPARPWLGVFTTEIEDKVVVAGMSPKGPAARAELKVGDVIVAVKGEKITTQREFYRKFWALGPAGVDVPLTLHREGDTFNVVLTSTDRTRLQKKPRLH